MDAGVNTFPARIPVTEGNSVGLHGTVETVFCDKEDGAVSLLHEDPVPLGETRPFEATTDLGTPVTVTVEPDADRDGYGDESQDACAASASIQAPCPPVELRARTRLRRRAMLVRVTASQPARVKVYGQVGWNYVPKKGKPRNRDGKRRLIVGLDGGEKQLQPGVTRAFRVRLPGIVLRRLNRLEPHESVRAKMSVVSTDAAGRQGLLRFRVKLKGRDRAGR